MPSIIPAVIRAPARGSTIAAAARLLALLSTWIDRSRQRRHLQRLSDDRLKDIGLTRADVAREAGKSFWLP
jgi:uncharacterized protein YjiS (DUF1127 family)